MLFKIQTLWNEGIGMNGGNKLLPLSGVNHSDDVRLEPEKWFGGSRRKCIVVCQRDAMMDHDLNANCFSCFERNRRPRYLRLLYARERNVSCRLGKWPKHQAHPHRSLANTQRIKYLFCLPKPIPFLPYIRSDRGWVMIRIAAFLSVIQTKVSSVIFNPCKAVGTSKSHRR